ncbi:MAG: DUF2723 domain-containing protein [Ardenticatenaceae bacterium]|nr:DUF2723 domain-containing protein [Ardenticatenaceae bacterium]
MTEERSEERRAKSEERETSEGSRSSPISPRLSSSLSSETLHKYHVTATILVLAVIPILYLLTLAQTLVLGDPTEYTFVANILGIAHPPGYAFFTVLGKLWQTIVPLGPIPWRMHLLSAAAATLAALFVYGTIRTLTQASLQDYPGLGRASAIFAALTVATATNHWQHAIHTNPHMLTAAFLAANLYFLTRWSIEERREKGEGREGQYHPSPLTSRPLPLYAFCLSAGLGVTHHPLTVMAFPAYALFVVWQRPSILREWRTLLKMVAFALLGLSVWLYFPLRSPMQPAFGPSTMNTLNGFLDHVLARGLSESLPYYSLADQPNRALVFWSLLRLQFSLPVIFLAVWGLFWLFMRHHFLFNPYPRRSSAPLPLLYLLAFLGNYAFVISLKAQDTMAYLIGPFLVIGLLAGFGLYGLLVASVWRFQLNRQMILLLVSGIFLLGPGLQVARNAPRLSLRHYSEGDDYVDAVFTQFQNRTDSPVLLNDWEHMTPLWYTRFVEGRWPEAANVRPEFVSAAFPWVESVFAYLPGGPVYLSNYRRELTEVGEDGFRLRPFGPFYQVVEPGDTSVPPELTPTSATGGDIEIIGYLLPQTQVKAGDYVPLTLALRTMGGTADYYVPVLQVGSISYPFTTDSHLITPKWKPGEVIIERFDFALPHDLLTGTYPLVVNLKNLSADEEFPLNLSLGTLAVTGEEFPLSTDHLLANFRQRVGLVSARVRGGDHTAAAPWPTPITAHPGDTLNIVLQWQSLAAAEESYTVFVHLIDLGNRPVIDNLDYTPLGGAFPTHLWIPKWLPGQRVRDPYRMQLPPDLPPGTYQIEVGLYEMVSKRRLHIADAEGNLAGDRYILGQVIVE